MAEIGVAGMARMGAVGITVPAAASSSLGISVFKRMNMQNDQRLHQEVIIYKKRRDDSYRGWGEKA